jgi:hypothetical protein
MYYPRVSELSKDYEQLSKELYRPRKNRYLLEKRCVRNYSRKTDITIDQCDSAGAMWMWFCRTLVEEGTVSIEECDVIMSEFLELLDSLISIRYSFITSMDVLNHYTTTIVSFQNVILRVQRTMVDIMDELLHIKVYNTRRHINMVLLRAFEFQTDCIYHKLNLVQSETNPTVDFLQLIKKDLLAKKFVQNEKNKLFAKTLLVSAFF